VNSKRKFKLIVFALLAILGVAIAVRLLEPVTTAEVNFSDESENFSADQDYGNLAPGDQWMIRFIDPPDNVDSRKVYTFECELISRKPEVLTTVCADFGEVVQDINWSKWSVYGAEGEGEYSVNDCKPDCASGNRYSVPVKVFLSDVTTDGKNFFLNTLTFTPVSEFSAPGSYHAKDGLEFTNTAQFGGKTVSAIIWDVASFYREVPDMRTKLPS